MLKTFIAALAVSILIVSIPAKADNSEEIAIGVGAFIGGMIIGGAINENNHRRHHHNYRRYEYVEPVRVYRPRKRCWDEVVGYYYNEPIVERICVRR